MEFHPLANLFPLMEGADFDEFVADIKANGQREPIIVHEGKILEGRNRWRATQELAIEPILEEYMPELDGESPMAFVMSRNLHRRHLSAGQRAMVVARMEASSERGEKQDMAALAHVDRKTLYQAGVVLENASPELVKAVDQGHIAVSLAAKAASLDPEMQREIAARATQGDANAARTIAKKGKRAEKEKALASKIKALPDDRFGVILADPEWTFEVWGEDTGQDRSAENHYPTSSLEAIKARKVGEIAAPDCVLFLWATVPMLPQALEVMAAWGFFYKSNYVWVKTEDGTGYWGRNRHELLLIGTRGHVPAPAMGTQRSSVIEAAAAEHSAKPEAALLMIEEYFPTLPKIELNRRGPARDGWSAWGADVDEPS